MSYIRPDDGVPSEMFLDAHDRGGGGGGPYVNCTCNIDHHATINPYDDEDIALPEESDIVKHHAYNSVSYFELDGQTFVYDCKTCYTKLRRYENFIWNNRNHIRNYLKIRIDQEKKWADQEHTLNILANI